MPNIKETMAVIDSTPIDQAVLLEGIHGIGKSECLTEHFKKQGYRVVTLFLGQLADAGDVIGLPSISKDENGNEITKFNPPHWWPHDPKEKVALNLDELNRGKPEVMQCVMDMVLNRKLNGKDLPPATKIISAMNPIDDNGYYQVDELDPAFLDRFNRYVFKPSIDEWLDWAVDNKLHHYVIGFVTKHTEHLDPQTDVEKNAKVNDVQPSRRSWKRVSDILNNGGPASKNMKLLGTMCLGIIGSAATSAFLKFVKEEGKGLHAGKIVTDWSQAIEAKLMTMGMQEIVNLNREITVWFHENTEQMEASRKNAVGWCKNVQAYLESIQPEAMAEFFDHVSTANNEGKKWPQLVIEANPYIGTKFYKIMQGDDENEEDASDAETFQD